MTRGTDGFELRFRVPQSSAAALRAEIARAAASFERVGSSIAWLDTPERSLARAGIAWSLRREGRRWIQSLSSIRESVSGRLEHEAIRPDATYDVEAHAATALGERARDIVAGALTRGDLIGERFRADLRRVSRRVRARGATIEVGLEEGRLHAAGATLRIREVVFVLVAGSESAALAHVERWRRKFDLIFEPRGLAERGERRAAGLDPSPVRKSAAPRYPSRSGARTALGAVLDECIAQIARNAIALVDADAAQRVEQVHQLRVGIRRLRSALRSFRGWTPAPPVELVASTRALFATLGRARDSDVLGSGVGAALVEAGAPALAGPVGEPGIDPVAAVRSPEAQRMLLGWIAWRVELDAQRKGRNAPAAGAAPTQPPGGNAPTRDEAPAVASGPVEHAAAGEPEREPEPEPLDLRRAALRRLRRWHRRIAADARAFDAFDEPALHALRKRIKRQRYAVEFFAPMLHRRAVSDYAGRLVAVQERMGELNDLFVARDRFQARVASEAAAWFALGWLAARIAQVRSLAKPALEALARTHPPR